MAKRKKFLDIPLREQIKPVFEERFREMLGSEDEYQRFVDCIMTPQKKSFRINTLKEENPEELVKSLKNRGLDFEKIDWIKNAYFLKFDKGKRSDLGNLYEHFLGKIYIQEATSMLPPTLLEIPLKIDDEFKVLDMAASPGSKTTQIGEMMNNCGTLVANELDYKRLGPLQINLERSGFTNIVISNLDGCHIEGEEVFDRVLLDAPCSGSGVIRKSPKTIKTYNPRKLKAIQILQLRLLKRAFALLKKGGILTYSTCSLDPEENEFVIEQFLEDIKEANLEEINIKNFNLGNRLKSFQGQNISKNITDKTVRVWPQHNDTNGFYIAKISK